MTLGCEAAVGDVEIFDLNDFPDGPEPVCTDLCIYDYDIRNNS